MYKDYHAKGLEILDIPEFRRQIEPVIAITHAVRRLINHAIRDRQRIAGTQVLEFRFDPTVIVHPRDHHQVVAGRILHNVSLGYRPLQKSIAKAFPKPKGGNFRRLRSVVIE